MRTALLALAFSLLTLPALALTKSELETCWGATENLRGTFTQTLQDGSDVSGTFYIQNAARMQMDYRNNFGARWVIGDGVIQQTSLHGSERKVDHTEQLGPFRSIFSTTPDFSRIIVGTGTNDHLTVVRAQHPQAPGKGYIDFTFENGSCRLVKWESSIEDFEHTTRLEY